MIALITGASSGIGEELAKKLAKRGFNLILTARRMERLEDIKQQIKSAYNVKVKILPYDLSKKEDCIA
ncbi:MAG: SDR family NAD(P)-dependent oxidoreductase, partial [Ruminiclostridium sp.]|nr:SDR family NAD(P)-dependent oxidoreductase [Ruminiclostridium sp.]